ATPPGTAATTTHFGPYNLLPEAHDAIRDWCKNHGYALAGPNWDIYGHWLHEWCDDPSKIRTDVFYLLKEDAAKPAAQTVDNSPIPPYRSKPPPPFKSPSAPARASPPPLAFVAPQ